MRNSTFIILYVIIAATLINIFFLSNKKLLENPKVKRGLRISVIIGIVFFFVVLILFLFLN
jgi:amino acid transporter